MPTPTSRRHLLLAALALPGLLSLPVAAQSIDHSHAAWTTLLKKHVLLLRGGQASQVRYAGMAADRPALKAYLASLSAVDAASFRQLQQATADGLSDQRLQRLHGRADPQPLPRT